jgi:L-lactate dehydrogenase (cytochrome)
MASKISAVEVAKHSSLDDCWIVVNGKVYDLTKFAPNHPGGAESESVLEAVQRVFH